jgi:hypothetical protein
MTALTHLQQAHDLAPECIPPLKVVVPEDAGHPWVCEDVGVALSNLVVGKGPVRLRAACVVVVNKRLHQEAWQRTTECSAPCSWNMLDTHEPKQKASTMSYTPSLQHLFCTLLADGINLQAVQVTPHGPSTNKYNHVYTLKLAFAPMRRP